MEAKPNPLPTPIAASPTPASALPPRDPFARLSDAVRTASSVQDWMIACLRIIAHAFSAPYAKVHARMGAQVIDEHWHQGKDDPRFWGAVVDRVLVRAMSDGAAQGTILGAKHSDAKVALLAAPLFDESWSAWGAIGLVANVRDEALLPCRLAQLEGICRVVSLLSEQRRKRQTAAAAPGAVAAMPMVQSAEELAFRITNELRNKLNCDIVALGMVRGPRVRVTAVSGLDEVRHNSPGIGRIRSAMEECLDADRILVGRLESESGAAESAHGYRLHQQWLSFCGGGVAASVPLRVGGRAVAVLSLHHRDAERIHEGQLEAVQGKVSAYAPTMLLAQRASRSVARHLRDAAAERWTELTLPGRYGRKAGVLLLVAGIGWFCFGTMDYRVTVPCKVVPTEARRVSAPMDGTLVAVLVAEGQHVRAGEPLCRFDTLELERQRAELEAQLEVWERRKDRALAEHASVEVRLAEAEQRLVQARLDIVRRRIERAVVRSPIDGIVMEGDRGDRVGDTAKIGEPLFLIASPADWGLELHIEESKVADVQVGQAAGFLPNARPENAQWFVIEHLAPTASIREGSNVYVARAVATDSRSAEPFSFPGGQDDQAGSATGPGEEVSAGRASWLKPGMYGVARIEAGARRVWWILLHRAVDWLHLHLGL